MEIVMATNKPNSSGGADYDTHELILLKEGPASLIALRAELAHHSDITDYAQTGSDFEDCMGKIAEKLDIALDGMYDVEPLCAVLVEALRKRRFHTDDPSLRVSGLIDVELVETEGEVTLVRRDRNVKTILPEEAVVTTSTSQLSSPKPTLNSEGTTEVESKAGKVGTGT